MPLRLHRRRMPALLLALWLPLALGLLLGQAGDRNAPGAILLLAEPLVVVAAVYAVMVQLAQRRVAFALALGIRFAGGPACLHLPAAALPVRRSPPRGPQPCATVPRGRPHRTVRSASPIGRSTSAWR